jgi:hypothetical protein
LHSRYQINLNREKSIEKAGKAFRALLENESKAKFIPNNLIARGDEYLKNLMNIMHEKKTHKKSCSITPCTPWKYPCIDLSFNIRSKLSPFKLKKHNFTPKPSESPIKKIKDRIKRVPPPNFMMGVKNFHKIYESDQRIDPNLTRVKNLLILF